MLSLIDHDPVTHATFGSKKYSYTTLICLKGAGKTKSTFRNLSSDAEPLTTPVLHDRCREEYSPSQIPSNVSDLVKHAMEVCLTSLARSNSHSHEACTLRTVYHLRRDRVITSPSLPGRLPTHTRRHLSVGLPALRAPRWTHHFFTGPNPAHAQRDDHHPSAPPPP